MATGDISNNLVRLERALRHSHYRGSLQRASLRAGRPEAFLPLLHFALLDAHPTVAAMIADRGFELFGKTDLRFVESVFKMLRTVFNYNPRLTKEQFFSRGFAEQKLIFLVDVLKLVADKSKYLGGNSSGVTSSTTSSKTPSVKNSNKQVGQPPARLQHLYPEPRSAAQQSPNVAVTSHVPKASSLPQQRKSGSSGRRSKPSGLKQPQPSLSSSQSSWEPPRRPAHYNSAMYSTPADRSSGEAELREKQSASDRNASPTQLAEDRPRSGHPRPMQKTTSHFDTNADRDDSGDDDNIETTFADEEIRSWWTQEVDARQPADETRMSVAATSSPDVIVSSGDVTVTPSVQKHAPASASHSHGQNRSHRAIRPTILSAEATPDRSPASQLRQADDTISLGDEIASLRSQFQRLEHQQERAVDSLTARIAIMESKLIQLEAAVKRTGSTPRTNAEASEPYIVPKRRSPPTQHKLSPPLSPSSRHSHGDRDLLPSFLSHSVSSSESLQDLTREGQPSSSHEGSPDVDTAPASGLSASTRLMARMYGLEDSLRTLDTELAGSYS